MLIRARYAVWMSKRAIGIRGSKHFENARAPTLCNFLETIFGRIMIKDHGRTCVSTQIWWILHISFKSFLNFHEMCNIPRFWVLTHANLNSLSRGPWNRTIRARQWSRHIGKTVNHEFRLKFRDKCLKWGFVPTVGWVADGCGWVDSSKCGELPTPERRSRNPRFYFVHAGTKPRFLTKRGSKNRGFRAGEHATKT